MKKILKLVFINLFVLIGLILLMDFSSLLILDTGKLYKNNFDKVNDEIVQSFVQLPNYEKVEWAKKHFEEFFDLDAKYYAYYGWRRLPYQGTTVNVDKQGIRYTPNKTALDSNLPQMVFLGGSTIWGTGVNDENTIPSLFSKQSNQYQVLNYGESGYNAYQSYQFFQIKVIEGLQPKLVISYDGVNNSPVKYKSFFSTARERQIADRMRGADTSPEGGTPTLKTHFLGPTKALIKKLFAADKRATGKILTFTPKRNREAAIELLESWLITKRLCDAIQSDFICILQPNIFVGKPITDYLPKKKKSIKFKNGFDYYKIVLELLETKRYKILKNHFIDMTNAFDHIPYLYIDYCHVSTEGNQIIANKINSYLKNINPE